MYKSYPKLSLKNKIIVFCNIINCFYTLYVKNYSYSIEDGIVFSFGSCNLCSLVKITNIRLGCRKFVYTKGKKILIIKLCLLMDCLINRQGKYHSCWDSMTQLATQNSVLRSGEWSVHIFRSLFVSILKGLGHDVKKLYSPYLYILIVQCLVKFDTTVKDH